MTSAAPPWKKSRDASTGLALPAESVSRHVLSHYFHATSHPPGEPDGVSVAKAKRACYLSVAVGLEVYSQLGFGEVRAVSLEAYFATRDDLERSVRGEPGVIGSVRGGPDNGRAEHVGLIVDGALIDLAAGQFARLPRMEKVRGQITDQQREIEMSRNLQVPDVIIIPPERQPADNTSDFAYFALNDGDVFVQYRIAPEGKLTEVDNWRRSPVSALLARTVMTELSVPATISPSSQAWLRGSPLQDQQWNEPTTPKK